MGPGAPFEIVEEEVLGERMQVIKNRRRSLRELVPPYIFTWPAVLPWRAAFEVALFSRGAAAEGSRGRKPPELEQQTIP